ncbi:hypothetical protein [Xenorhabdus bovienii]|uniref:Arc-like DNA binding domain-containing protein n=1 Tax=Xenorhabdus bovienii str. Intermedium TaxID=1379677 RepID=A0A077QK31_XENBV|nr:hypothetical protein [Xenorhabdus bovienii]CDH33909.1 conserved hypothetical protein [Xenorhabdus bovienii str. Intermedium]
MENNKRITPYPFRMKPEMRQWLEDKAEERRRSVQVQLEYIVDIVMEMERKGELQLP